MLLYLSCNSILTVYLVSNIDKPRHQYCVFKGLPKAQRCMRAILFSSVNDKVNDKSW